ncbi:MAG: HDOD domain-containing protein [Candidatus Eisenbacteria bacterium]
MSISDSLKVDLPLLLATIEDDPSFAGMILRNLVASGWETCSSPPGEGAVMAGSVHRAMTGLLRLLARRTGATHTFAGFGGESEGLRFVWTHGFPNPEVGGEWIRERWPRLAASLDGEGAFEGAEEAPSAENGGSEKVALRAVPIRAGENGVGVLGAVWPGPGAPPREENGCSLRNAAFLLGHTVTEIWEKNRTHGILYSMIQSLAAALDARDAYTRGHSDRVAIYAMAVANEMGIDEASDRPFGFRDQLRLGALLHDIGKVGIPDEILRKPSKLTIDEIRAVKEHPVLGAEIVRSSGSLDHIIPGILLHHERLDGSGYPMGLVGDEIPLEARIIGIADVFDALTSGRPYRDGLAHGDAVDIISKGSGTEFDPEVVEALVRTFRKGVLTAVRVTTTAVTGHMTRERERIERERPGLGDRVPSAPVILHRVTQIIRDPNSSVSDIAHVISADEGLVVRLLKVANSAFYALPGRVGTIPMAVTLLGMNTLKNIVIGTAMSDVARSFLGTGEESLRLWDHGIRVGVWCRALARAVGSLDGEEAFTAGLLHDLGKGVVLRELPKSQSRLRNLILERRECRILEKEAIGFDHAQLGAWALGRWRLPESLVLAVRYHHEPRAAEETSEEVTRLVWVTHVADVIAHEEGDDPERIREVVARHADPLVAHYLPLGDGRLFDDLRPRVRDDLEVARRVFAETETSPVR